MHSIKRPLALIRQRSEEAFSLIELAVVIVFIGVLSAIAIPMFAGQDKKVETEQARVTLAQAVSIVEKATIDNNGLYPTYKPNAMKQDSKMNAIEYRYSTDRLSWCMSIPSPEGTLYYASDGSVKGATLPPCLTGHPNIGS